MLKKAINLKKIQGALMTKCICNIWCNSKQIMGPFCQKRYKINFYSLISLLYSLYSQAFGCSTPPIWRKWGHFCTVTGKGQIHKNSMLNQILISPKCSLNTISDELKGKQCSPHSNIVRSSNVCAILSILVPTCIRMSLPKVA